MSLEEEIKIIQFGQGVCPDTDLLEPFRQLDQHEKQKQVFNLYLLVQRSKPNDADIEQALADGAFDKDYSPCIALKGHPRRTSVSPFSDDPESDYKFLLCLFRIDYQRRYALEKENPTSWMYRDLSSKETVDAILKKYEDLVEEVYNTAGFRSEFVSIAKLWHDRETPAHTEPRQTHFHYITYDELLTQSIKLLENKQTVAISMLCHAIEQALSKKYGLDAGQVNRITLAVIDRHLHETYNSSLFK